MLLYSIAIQFCKLILILILIKSYSYPPLLYTVLSVLGVAIAITSYEASSLIDGVKKVLVIPVIPVGSTLLRRSVGKAKVNLGLLPQ